MSLNINTLNFLLFFLSNFFEIVFLVVISHRWRGKQFVHRVFDLSCFFFLFHNDLDVKNTFAKGIKTSKMSNNPSPITVKAIKVTSIPCSAEIPMGLPKPKE